MRALYLHGFLGSKDDMKPLFLKGVDCESVNVKEYLEDPLKLMNHHKGSYDYAVAYSFGGRFLAKCLELDSSFVKKPIFCSSRITGYTDEELIERQKFKVKLLSLVEQSVEEFYNYWDTLALFSGHKMNVYREEYEIKNFSWTKQQIIFFLTNHFTYIAPDMSSFEEHSVYFFGEKDLKYKKVSESLKMRSLGFENLGHRFLFESPELFKKVLENEVLN